MIFGRLFLLFLIVPLIEIGLFLTIGRTVGVPLTIGLILFTAVLGAALTRSQGLRTLARFQEKLASGSLPGAEVMSGLLILVAGAVLLTPGFLTDFIGFSLLIPPLRGAIGGWLAKRYASKLGIPTPPMGYRKTAPHGTGRTVEGEGQVIEVEVVREDEKPSR